MDASEFFFSSFLTVQKKQVMTSTLFLTYQEKETSYFLRKYYMLELKVKKVSLNVPDPL